MRQFVLSFCVVLAISVEVNSPRGISHYSLYGAEVDHRYIFENDEVPEKFAALAELDDLHNKLMGCIIPLKNQSSPNANNENPKGFQVEIRFIKFKTGKYGAPNLSCRPHSPVEAGKPSINYPIFSAVT